MTSFSCSHFSTMRPLRPRFLIEDRDELKKDKEDLRRDKEDLRRDKEDLRRDKEHLRQHLDLILRQTDWLDASKSTTAGIDVSLPLHGVLMHAWHGGIILQWTD